MSDVGKKLAFLDVDKFARFSSSTFRADKFYKTIGYGLGSVGHLMSLSAGRDSDVSSGFKAISSNIGMARFVIRFTGGFESYEAFKNGSWYYSDDDAHLRRIVDLQAISMLVYYPLEHLSYVGFVYVGCNCHGRCLHADFLDTDDTTEPPRSSTSTRTASPGSRAWPGAST